MIVTTVYGEKNAHHRVGVHYKESVLNNTYFVLQIETDLEI